MKTTRMLCVTLLWLASTSAYGEDHWSSRDPFTNEFYTRMNNYQPERFLYDQSFRRIQKRSSPFREVSRLENLFRLNFRHRDMAEGYIAISDVKGANILEVRFYWDFLF